MQAEIRFYIFDLDGTLVDSFADIAAAVNRTLAHLRLAMLHTEDITRHIGQGAHHLLGNVLRMIGIQPTDRLFGEQTYLDVAREHFMRFYEAHLAEATTVYPRVRETLQALDARGLPMAVCSNKPHILTEKLLQALSLRHHFIAVLGGDQLPERKPHPRPLLYLLSQTRAKAEDTLMVGDSIFDIQAGQAACMQTCAVTYGNHDTASMRLLAPDYIIDRFDALLELPLLKRNHLCP